MITQKLVGRENYKRGFFFWWKCLHNLNAELLSTQVETTVYLSLCLGFCCVCVKGIVHSLLVGGLRDFYI